MWPNLQLPADLVPFTKEKSLMENFIFCTVGFKPVLTFAVDYFKHLQLNIQVPK